MARNTVVFLIIGILALLVWLVPLTTASIMNRITQKQTKIASSAIKENPQTEPKKINPSALLLMVKGEIILIDEGGVSFIVLVSTAGKKYILTGQKTEELKSLSGKKVTVIGAPKPPLPPEIKGNIIKRNIEVKNFQVEDTL